MTDKSPVTTSGQGIDPLVGKVLSDRYELTALVARGGMGKIYRAIQRPLGRPVALKVLDLHDDDREFRDRFFLEASLCAKLTHPHTIRIYDYGTTSDGIFYIAMEYLEGESLQHILAREAPLEPLRAIRIVRQVCGALAEAHDCGIIHRDLKPGNVFLTPHSEDREFAKVLDFGLVKELGKESELSRTGAVLGSPLYISPEQVNGQPVDQRADIYATGLILYYMLTGRTAFRKGNALSLLMMQTTAAPPPFREANPELDVPASLEWIVMRCLEKRPGDRFGSMHELLRALKAVDKEMRGEVAGPLVLKMQGGRVLLPDGLEISSEIRLHHEPHVAGVVTDPTLVTTSRTGGAVGVVVLLGTVAMVLGFVVLVGVLIVAIVGGTVYNNPGAEPVPVSAPPTPVTAAPVAPAPVEVVLTSVPAGAEVVRAEDESLLGVTPYKKTLLPGDDLDVVVRAKGFEPQKMVLSADNPTPSVRLAPVRKASPRPTPAPAQPTAPEPTPAPVPVAPAPKPRPGDLKGWE